MRRAGALLLALSTLPESARPADMKGLPDAPSGYVLLQHHSVGNSANCGGAGGPGHGCHNMDPPDQLKNAGCGPGAAACFEQAKVACETDKQGCVAFALRCVGSDDPTKVNGFQTYRAGIGNAVPNDDWCKCSRSLCVFSLKVAAAQTSTPSPRSAAAARRAPSRP